LKILDEKTKEKLDELLQMECDMINRFFDRSEAAGVAMLGNSLKSFRENYLVKKYGDVIPGMCSEYRVFIVGVLKGIKEEYQPTALSNILIPKAKQLGDAELLKILQD